MLLGSVYRDYLQRSNEHPLYQMTEEDIQNFGHYDL
jgi:hypothetical protein